MTPRPSIRIPTARDEALPWARVAAVTIVAFAVGASAARASLDRDLSREVATTQDAVTAEHESRSTSDLPPSPRDGTAPDAERSDASAGAQILEAEPPPAEALPSSSPAAELEEASREAAPTVAPAGPTAPIGATGPASVVHGRIAYIRCDGLPPQTGPVPCPRDLSMERAVWTAIDRLPGQCPALGNARGAADVRVVFDGSRVSGLGFRDLPAPALPTEAIRGCLEPALRGVAQTLGATRLTASFRFDLR